MKEILESIGLPAVLEGTAEECSELTKACLKLARKLRGENPTPVSMEELVDNLMEEMADVKVCLKVLNENYQIDQELETTKTYRWLNRIRKARNEKQNNAKN